MKMKHMILILAALLLIGCGSKDHESAVKTEKAKVMQLAYVPASEGHTSGGAAITSSGKVGFVFGQTVRTPEIWAVVLRCEDHQKTFSLQGKEIYQNVSVGDIVTLEYVDIIRDTDTGPQVVDVQTKRVLTVAGK